MKRLKNLLILFSIIIFVSIAISSKIKLVCVFKKYLNINCPGCGLTRAFKSILSFDLITATKYNVLSIPLFICMIIFIFSIIKDIVLNKETTIVFLNNIFKRHCVILLIIIFITMIINNINSMFQETCY